jgi:hypothetical protein
MSNAMSGGKQAARKIDERLMSQQQSGQEKSGIVRWEQLFPEFEYSHATPGEPSLSRRHTAHSLSPAARARSQQEVVSNLTPQEALEECRRCLRCDLRGTPSGS